MIHVALNHWRTADWLRVQVGYLHEMLTPPYRIVACVEDIPAAAIPDVDEVVEGIGGNHAGKLNLLGHRIVDSASDDSDGLVFLAATMLPVTRAWLEPPDAAFELLSVTDDRFYPAVQPHPAFCSTTVGLWRSLPGDWAPGFESLPDRDIKTMAGANLLDRLVHSEVSWGAHRAVAPDPSNPVSFAMFGEVLYHHASLARRLVAAGMPEATARGVADDVRGADRGR